MPRISHERGEKMKKSVKKLRLSRETIRDLTKVTLPQVVGGYSGGCTTMAWPCPTFVASACDGSCASCGCGGGGDGGSEPPHWCLIRAHH